MLNDVLVAFAGWMLPNFASSHLGSSPSTRHRAGITLIELMVLISIFASLLLPAENAARALAESRVAMISSNWGLPCSI